MNIQIRKDWKKIVQVTVKAIAYAFLGFLILLLISVATNLPGGFRVFTVMSGSMEPALRTGSVVVTKSAGEYKTGDIVTFYSEAVDGMTTHRISQVVTRNQDTFFRTKGDANDSEDARIIGSDNILGREIFTLPYLGYLISFTRSKVGFLLLIVVPALLILIDEFKVLFSEVKTLRKEKMHQKENKTTLITIIILLSLILLSKSNSSLAYIKSQTKLADSDYETHSYFVDFYFTKGKTAVGFNISGASQLNKIMYEITYKHDGGLAELIQGSIDNTSGNNEIIRDKMTLGTCSEIGEVCVYHTGIGDIRLRLTLITTDGSTLIEERNLTF